MGREKEGQVEEGETQERREPFPGSSPNRKIVWHERRCPQSLSLIWAGCSRWTWWRRDDVSLPSSYISFFSVTDRSSSACVPWGGHVRVRWELGWGLRQGAQKSRLSSWVIKCLRRLQWGWVSRKMTVPWPNPRCSDPSFTSSHFHSRCLNTPQMLWEPFHCHVAEVANETSYHTSEAREVPEGTPSHSLYNGQINHTLPNCGNPVRKSSEESLI